MYFMYSDLSDDTAEETAEAAFISALSRQERTINRKLIDPWTTRHQAFHCFSRAKNLLLE